MGQGGDGDGKQGQEGGGMHRSDERRVERGVAVAWA